MPSIGVLLLLLVARSLGQQCEDFPIIDASIKIDKFVNVFYKQFIINTDTANQDFPWIKPDSIRSSAALWPYLRSPVEAIYENRTTINFITRAGEQFEVSQFSRNHQFIFRAKFSKLFPLKAASIGADTFSLEKIYSLVNDESKKEIIFCLRVKHCAFNVCKVSLATASANPLTGSVASFDLMPDSIAPFPNAMLDLEEWADHIGVKSAIIAFYGPFYMVMPITGILYKDIRNVYKSFLRMNNHWLGCPQMFCFEGDIDAIVKVLDMHKYVMFRGANHWILDSFPFSGQPPNPKAQIFPGLKIQYMDAAFSSQSKGITYFFSDDKVFLRTTPNEVEIKDISTVFKGLNEKWLDAAFATEEEVYIFKSYYFWVYDIKTLAPKVVKRKLTDLKGLPHTIDAALALSANNFFIFKRSHNFNFNLDLLKKKGPFDSKPSHENLFKCDRSFYENNAHFRAHLDITDYNSFLEFRRRSKPRPMNDSDIPVTKAPIPPPASTLKSSPKQSTRVSKGPKVTAARRRPSSNVTGVLLIVVGAVVVTLCLAVVVFAAFTEMKRNKKNREANAATAKAESKRTPKTVSSRVSGKKKPKSEESSVQRSRLMSKFSRS